jgi:hypothetical protein
VTRGTRPKKPSSSCGFAREAQGTRGTRGSWGLKTEHFFPLFSNSQQQKKNSFYFIFLILFSRVREDATARPCADAGAHPRGRIYASADGKNPSVNKTASVG